MRESYPYDGLASTRLPRQVIARIARAKRPRRELYGIQFDMSTVPPPASVTGVPLFPEGAAEGASSLGVLTSLLYDPKETEGVGASPFDAPFGLALIKVRAS